MKPPLDQDRHKSESRSTRLFSRQPRRRRPSLLDRWIQDQQCQNTGLDVGIRPGNFDDLDNDPLPAPGSLCHPYLAYPHLSRSSLPLRPVDDAKTQCSYEPAAHPDGTPSESCIQEPFVLLSTPRSLPHSRFLHKPSSLRNFQLPFRSPMPSSAEMSQETSQTTSRRSLLRRLSRLNGLAGTTQTHARSTSLNLPNQVSTDGATSGLSTFSSAWKWRPSVLGQFSSSRVPEICVSTASDPDSKTPTAADAPRQSTSSCASEEEGLPPLSFTTSILSHESSKSRLFKFGAGSASSPSLWSQPTSHSVSSNDPVHLTHKASTVRMPGTSRQSLFGVNASLDSDDEGVDPDAIPSDFDPSVPYVAYSAQDSKRLSLNSLTNVAWNRKKKRLVIKGIQIHESRKFEAAKQWCENFGEVSQITRVPNGDLHVDFARAEVADTVCRLKANVYISGIGSVYLSWYTGNKYR